MQQRKFPTLFTWWVTYSSSCGMHPRKTEVILESRSSSSSRRDDFEIGDKRRRSSGTRIYRCQLCCVVYWTVVVWTLYFLGQQLIRRPRHYHDHRPHITMNMITEFVLPCNPLHFSKHHQRRMNHVVHRFYTVIPAHLRFYCQKKQHPPKRFYPNKSSLEIRACVCWRRRHLPECWNVCLPLPGL